ncbi:MAG: sulfate respiration complex protein HmcE [Desulfovibrionaceae bacterium]
MYQVLTGPLLWASIIICVVGLAVRVVRYIRGLDALADRVAYSAFPTYGIKGAVRSILFWMLPFGTRSWRVKPGFTIMFFAFHAALVIVPLFLMGHAMVLGVDGFWPTLPMPVADALTVATLVAAVFVALRRIGLPEVRILTTAYDWIILLLAVVPVLSGFLAVHHVGDYDFWLYTHIISGEICLVAIPFTKLYHVVGFFLSRAQLGMDFGIKRGGKKKNFAW